jgi:uncharacterized membrane protein
MFNGGYKKMPGFFGKYGIYVIAPFVLAILVFLVLFVFVDLEEESISYIIS